MTPDRDLRRELLPRAARDQSARRQLAALVDANGAARAQSEADATVLRQVRQVDAENTAWLTTIVDAGGWPTISRVGEDGSTAAWLLVQHADADRTFQRHCVARQLDGTTCAPG